VGEEIGDLGGDDLLRIAGSEPACTIAVASTSICSPGCRPQDIAFEVGGMSTTKVNFPRSSPE